MSGIHITPVHPGEVLKDELEEIGVSRSALAMHIRVSGEMIDEICQCRLGITVGMAVRLSRALGGSPRFWLNLQNNWELSRLTDDNLDNIERIAA